MHQKTKAQLLASPLSSHVILGQMLRLLSLCKVRVLISVLLLHGALTEIIIVLYNTCRAMKLATIR